MLKLPPLFCFTSVLIGGWRRDSVSCGSSEICSICVLLFWSRDGKEMAVAPHSSTLGWKIPWTEEPGRLQSMGLLRVGHDWATSLSLFTSIHWRRKWQPTPVLLPGESYGRGSLVGCCLWGHNRTWLKRLSSSSSKLTNMVIGVSEIYIVIFTTSVFWLLMQK